MNLQTAFVTARNQLFNAGLSESEQEAKLICAAVIDCQPKELLWHYEDVLSYEQEQRLQQFITKRSERYPLQYLLGVQEFMSLDFLVTPAVLIPRWDTERVVEAALALLKGQNKITIADICCGSGAIGISLAYYLPQSEVFLSDISPEALEVAKQNAERHQVEKRCHFLAGDLLQPLQKNANKVDLLISNPPYIKEADLANLPHGVQCEPQMALSGGVDGLDFYRRLLQDAKKVLLKGGFLVLETGYEQKETVCSLLQEKKFLVKQTVDDYGGNHRGIVAVYE